jgi:hypothetical protein
LDLFGGGGNLFRGGTSIWRAKRAKASLAPNSLCHTAHNNIPYTSKSKRLLQNLQPTPALSFKGRLSSSNNTIIMPPKISKKKKTVVVDLSDSEDDNDMNFNDSDDESETLVVEVEPPKKSAASTKQNNSPSKTKSPSSSKDPSSPKKFPKSPEAAEPEPVNDSFDVILPPLLGTNSNGECTVLVQLDPQDAVTLDYEGVSGAIGRFEADDRGGKYDYDSKQFGHTVLFCQCTSF